MVAQLLGFLQGCMQQTASSVLGKPCLVKLTDSLVLG